MNQPFELGKPKIVWSVAGVAPMEVVSVPVQKPAEKLMHWQYVTLNNNLPGAVALAVHENKIALVKEWRLPIKNESLEIPRGRAEEGETTCQTAIRELREETGLETLQALELGKVFPDSGTLSAPIGVAVLTVNDPVGTGVTDDEINSWKWVELAKVQDLIASNDLNDGISLAALQLWTAKGKPLP